MRDSLLTFPLRDGEDLVLVQVGPLVLVGPQ
jgi:hypothetical protein